MAMQTASDFCWVQLLRTWHLLLDDLGLCWFLPFCGAEGLGSCICITKTSLGTLCVGRRVSCKGSLQDQALGRYLTLLLLSLLASFLIFVSKQATGGFICKDI